MVPVPWLKNWKIKMVCIKICFSEPEPVAVGAKIVWEEPEPIFFCLELEPKKKSGAWAEEKWLGSAKLVGSNPSYNLILDPAK